MSLCRNYPTPSNRMGVMWSLMPLENSIVLEYGPAGTTHFGAGLYSSLGIKLDNSLFTTHISEDDIIMGDVTRLEKAIVEVDKTYKPEVIFIVAAAVIAVIGTDIKGVCSYMQDEVNAKLICFDDGGFGGDYTVGLKNSYTTLIKEFALENKFGKDVNKYNILGASASNFRIRSDVWEIKELMRDYFQMESGAVLGLETTVEELKKMSEAAINIVLRKEALPCAKLLNKRFGTPYIYQTPYGYEGTFNWLEEIEEIIGREMNHEFKERLVEKITDNKSRMEFIKRMMGHRYKYQAKASIIGDYDTILGFETLCEEFAIEVDKKICNHSLKTKECIADNIMSFKKEKDKIDQLLEIDHQFVLGDEIALNICNETNTKVCVSFPFPSKRQIATHLPFMGEKGADYLLEIIDNYLMTIK